MSSLPETSRLAILYLKNWIARAAPIIKDMLVSVGGAIADPQNAQDVGAWITASLARSLVEMEKQLERQKQQMEDEREREEMQRELADDAEDRCKTALFGFPRADMEEEREREKQKMVLEEEREREKQEQQREEE